MTRWIPVENVNKNGHWAEYHVLSAASLARVSHRSAWSQERTQNTQNNRRRESIGICRQLTWSWAIRSPLPRGRTWSAEHVNRPDFTLTSNCQWAACRSCFAWSAAQPAVKTNWLIMTWCLSSSIFTDMATFHATRGCFKVENKTNKMKSSLRSTPLNPQTQSSLPDSQRSVSAASSSNNNIFMSSPTTKRSAQLIGRLRSETVLHRRWLADMGTSLNLPVCLFYLSETLRVSGVQQAQSMISSPPSVVILHVCTRAFSHVRYTDVITRWLDI